MFSFFSQPIINLTSDNTVVFFPKLNSLGLLLGLKVLLGH